MKSIFHLLLSIFFIIIVTSCGPSQEEKADSKINEANKIAANGDTLKAIGLLKSIPVLFPKAIFNIDASKKMVNKFYRQMIDYRSEQLSATETKIAELEKNFTKEKTEFDRYVQYIPNKLTLARSWNKSFLQVTLDERGEIFLTSNYMGKDWLKHTAIKIYDGGLQIKTPSVPLDDPNNRKSDFLDYKWEKVSYTQGLSDSTIRFIVKNMNRQLKCAFMGANYYYIILEDFNKEAIRDAYNLSVAIKNKNEMIGQIKELEAKRK
jgi:hypothetical protein